MHNKLYSFLLLYSFDLKTINKLCVPFSFLRYKFYNETGKYGIYTDHVCAPTLEVKSSSLYKYARTQL